MKYRIALTPEVNAEILSMSAYFEGAREGSGVLFESELQTILESILEAPFLYPKEYGPVRRALVQRFNTIVFYSVEADLITVQEIRDARRKPPNWRRRGFRDN